MRDLKKIRLAGITARIEPLIKRFGFVEILQDLKPLVETC